MTKYALIFTLLLLPLAGHAVEEVSYESANENADLKRLAYFSFMVLTEDLKSDRPEAIRPCNEVAEAASKSLFGFVNDLQVNHRRKDWGAEKYEVLNLIHDVDKMHENAIVYSIRTNGEISDRGITSLYCNVFGYNWSNR